MSETTLFDVALARALRATPDCPQEIIIGIKTAERLADDDAERKQEVKKAKALITKRVIEYARGKNISVSLIFNLLDVVKKFYGEKTPEIKALKKRAHLLVARDSLARIYRPLINRYKNRFSIPLKIAAKHLWLAYFG